MKYLLAMAVAITLAAGGSYFMARDAEIALISSVECLFIGAAALAINKGTGELLPPVLAAIAAALIVIWVSWSTSGMTPP